MANTSTLSIDLNGDVVTEEHPDYPRAIARWAKNAERRAKIVVFVKDEHDVSLSIKHAKANNLPIAIHGGGHSPAGASSSDGGLVIDLSRYMNEVRVDPDKNLAYVGGGALWEAVDKAAIKHDLATVGGTVNHTGVGGLLLGGGYGWLSASYGLVIDNLIQATIVTADGSVLTAGPTENSDLFFGIRGGGCNFGVATEFVLKLHPQRLSVYSGVLIFAPSALEQLITVTQTWLTNAGEKEAMIQMTTVGPDGNPVIVLYPFYNGTEAEGRENFKAFLDIGPLADMTKEIPYEEVNALQNPMVKHGNGVYMKGLAHKHPHYASIKKAHERVIDICKDGALRANVIYEYFPLAKINTISNSAMAFRRDPTPSVLLAFAWKGESPDKSDEARALARELAGIITGGQSELTNTQSLGYSNYGKARYPEGVTGEKGMVTDKAKLVFGENYPALQQIKNKYDPENIFNKWFPILPAV